MILFVSDVVLNPEVQFIPVGSNPLLSFVHTVLGRPVFLCFLKLFHGTASTAVGTQLSRDVCLNDHGEASCAHRHSHFNAELGFGFRSRSVFTRGSFMEGWYSFDHLACDALKLFTLRTTCWAVFRAFHGCPASRLLALHLCRVDRGGVRWTATVMAAVFPCIEMDALLVRLLLGSFACPRLLGLAQLIARFGDRIVLSLLLSAGSGITSSHCSSWSLQGSRYSWCHTCVISLSRIAPLGCSTPQCPASLSHPAPTVIAQDLECTERSF